jgi:hypothetical protein
MWVKKNGHCCNERRWGEDSRRTEWQRECDSATDTQTQLQRAWCARESDYHSTTGERPGKHEERGSRLWLRARSRNAYHKAAGTGGVAHASLGGSTRNAVAAFLCVWSDVWEGECATQQSDYHPLQLELGVNVTVKWMVKLSHSCHIRYRFNRALGSIYFRFELRSFWHAVACM